MKTLTTHHSRAAAALVTAALLTACGAQQAVDVQATPGASGMGDRWSLAEVAEACASSYTGEQPGRVHIAGELRDANTSVTIPAACILDLGPDAGVTLNNVEVASDTLNIFDRNAAAGENRVSLHRVTFTGTANSGLLVELSDPEDVLRAEASEISYPAGVAVKVLGQREDTNTHQGGSVSLTGTDLAATGEGTFGVMVMASEHDGKVRAVNATVQTPGNVVFLAADCRVSRRGQRADCSTDVVAADLQRQAAQMNPG